MIKKATIVTLGLVTLVSLGGCKFGQNSQKDSSNVVASAQTDQVLIKKDTSFSEPTAPTSTVDQTKAVKKTDDAERQMEIKRMEVKRVAAADDTVATDDDSAATDDSATATDDSAATTDDTAANDNSNNDTSSAYPSDDQDQGDTD